MATKDQNRFDRWLSLWSRSELLSYADLTGIANSEELIDDNMYHIGGIPRYAFVRSAAEQAIMNAASILGGKDLLKVDTTNLKSKKYEQQKIVDRLLHRHPPPSGVGVYGSTYSFASEFVPTRVSMAIALETEIETAPNLLSDYKGMGAAGSMRGVLFDAYAARELAAGGTFAIKEVGSKTEATLTLPPTAILQKDTKVLCKTNYPTAIVQDKVVWPNPVYNMPAIDRFIVMVQELMAFQMTVVDKDPGLDLKGAKAFLKYFDSIHRELQRAAPLQTYRLYFAVPGDIFDTFSNAHSPANDMQEEWHSARSWWSTPAVPHENRIESCNEILVLAWSKSRSMCFCAKLAIRKEAVAHLSERQTTDGHKGNVPQ